MAKVCRFKIVKPMDGNVSWDMLSKILKDLAYSTWVVQNKTIQWMHQFQLYGFGFNDKVGAFPKKEDMREILSGYESINGFIGNKLKEEVEMPRPVLDGAVNDAEAKYKSHRISMLSGKESLISFRNSGNIFSSSKIMKIFYAENGDLVLAISLLSKPQYKELGLKNGRINVILSARDGHLKSMADKLVSGEYKLCDSMLIKDKKGKWCLNACYAPLVGKPVKQGLDKDKILGIDLGIAKAVYCATNYDKWWRWSIDGGEITAFMTKQERLRKSGYKDAKVYTEAKHGKGLKRKREFADRVGNRVADYRNYINHKYAKHILQQAVKMGCGVIQMEDLSGINSLNTFLKKWSYYDLQSKVKYKAEEIGIEVVMVDPKYTSQRCSECGHIDENNRNTQSEFKCIKCEYEVNADFNAARNIATKDIEHIIKNERETK